MKIYLAIPYSGNEEESFRTANAFAGKLMRKGHIVFSPISHSHPISKTFKEMPWEFWKSQDEAFLEWCDELCVIMADGWEDSRGVTEEIEIIKEMKKPINYMDTV